MREAYQIARNRELPIFAELAVLGAVPEDTARAVFARWLGAGSSQTRLALPWWSARGDTASIRMFERHANRLARSGASPDERVDESYDTAAAQAHLSLARRDTAEALRRFVALPDTLCLGCYVDRLTRARLLTAYRRDGEALATLRESLVAFLTPIEVIFALERGRVAERLRRGDEAVRSYRLVVDAWRHADRELKARVDEARGALERVTAADGVQASSEASSSSHVLRARF